jgi:hypothetical protein
MRWIALLSISIALLTSPGCATLGTPKTQEQQEGQPLPSSRPDLSRALHAVYDWAER